LIGNPVRDNLELRKTVSDKIINKHLLNPDTIKKQLSIYFLFAGFLLAASCKKDNVEETRIATQPAAANTFAGFGNTPGAPTGSPFYLPDNVKLTTPMNGHVPDYSSYQKYGIGTIGAFFILANPNNYNVNVELPAGLIFLPDNDSSQTGMNSCPVTILINAGDSEKICLRFFCMNRHKFANYVNFYIMHVVSDNDQVKTLTDALKIKSESILLNHAWELQEIVWHITDGSGITQTDLDVIQSW
jgi:hypothetical protein